MTEWRVVGEAELPEIFTLHINSWVIEDGNYDEFSVGQVLEVPLEPWIQSARVEVVPGHRGIWDHGNGHHTVAGTVVAIAGGSLAESRAWTLDTGIFLCREEPPPYSFDSGTSAATWQVGDFVKAEVDLAFPQPYPCEGLCKLEGMPPTVYRWRVEAIDLDTTPRTARGGIDIRYPPSYRRIEYTSRETRRQLLPLTGRGYGPGWVNAGYLLHCRLLPVPPRYLDPNKDALTAKESDGLLDTTGQVLAVSSEHIAS